MGSMRHTALLTCALLLAFLPTGGRAGPVSTDHAKGEGESLFAQSVAETLNRDFPSRDISFLLLAVSSKR